MPEDAAVIGEFGLRDYLRVLARRKTIVVVTVAVLVGVTLVLEVLKTPVYAAESKVVLREGSNGTVFDTSGANAVDPARIVQTEIEMFTSPAVQAKVRAAIGSAPDVSAHAIAQTDVIAVRATSTKPARAANVANVYAEAYVDVRREQAVNDLLAAAKQIQDQVGQLQHQIDATSDDAQKNRLRDQQAVFNEKLDQLQVDSALKTGGAELAAPAKVPTSPFSPKPIRSGALALAVALFVGVGLAFLVEYLDDSVKGKEDVQRAGGGIDVLGLIPAVASWKQRQEALVVSVAEPGSPPAEAYRTLRTAVQFLALDHPLTRIQVTSANAQEGKTTTLANLGVAFARAGHRVVLVCCDLRRPRIHDFFGVSNGRGLTSVLLGEVPLRRALQPTSTERLFVLASGALPPNPSELLASKRVSDVLDALRDDGYLVLIDSPPVLPVTDAMVLSTRVDATLLVCVAGETTRKEVARAVELLNQVGAPLVGAVLNGVTEEVGYPYRYGYYRTAEDVSPAPRGVNGDGTRRPASADDMKAPNGVARIGDRLRRRA
jgi:capsular exopolysaccharide synthesis family protein